VTVIATRFDTPYAIRHKHSPATTACPRASRRAATELSAVHIPSTSRGLAPLTPVDPPDSPTVTSRIRRAPVQLRRLPAPRRQHADDSPRFVTLDGVHHTLEGSLSSASATLQHRWPVAPPRFGVEQPGALALTLENLVAPYRLDLNGETERRNKDWWAALLRASRW